MANANLRQDEYRQDRDQYSGPSQDDYNMSASGGYAPSNYPQHASGNSRHRQDNDEYYGSRREYAGSTAYNVNDFPNEGPQRHMPQNFERYNAPRRDFGYPRADQYPPDVGPYGHGGGEPYRSPNHNVRQYVSDDFSPAWQAQGYPNYPRHSYSGQHGGSHPADYGRDWGDYRGVSQGYSGSHVGSRQGTSGEIGDYYNHQHHHIDPDYHQWRREQIQNLDSDYDEWRQQRYSKFADEFNSWRSNRPAREKSKNHDSSGSSDNNGTNASSHSGKSSSGSKS